ncbi:elongation factor P [Rubricoccus marinus]|uniref:Elongation factor P n=1 Tax=Rubricoccus marinus TaxID=716817 RepID=A0A259TW32_9BACT|nr:elongation factor P [Rubricoccus marinus]OZC01900.1 elongation factor P [Rubricoccus marinus]
MASTQDFRNGLVFTWKNDLWQIVEFQHVKPGKGGAFVRGKLKNVRNGKIVDNTFRAGEKIEIARVERREMQYLYEDDLGLHFMNTETYEQRTLRADMVEDKDFIKEGGMIDVLIDAGTEEALNVELPRQVELIVTQTDPGLKGDTAQGATKPATLESGATVNVPLFINEGDLIRVDIESKSYQTRVTAA